MQVTAPLDLTQPTAEAGTGMVSSVVGVTAFLVVLLFAVQLSFNLYATSTVTAAAFDAARIVAGADGDEATAESHLRSLLAGQDLAVRWDYRDTDATPGPDVVALTVEVENPTRLLRLVPVPYQHVNRTVTVRLEDFR
jgi:hypothetical protein